MAAQVLLQPGQVAAHHRLQGGVERGRRAALELAISGSTSVAAVTWPLGQISRTRATARASLTRIGVGVDEEHADRLAAARQQLARRRLDLVQVDLGVDRAVGQHPLVDLQPQVARHQGS